MEDKVFGTLSFRFGWTKNEQIKFCGKLYDVRIRTSSLKDELPTELQQNSYLSFEAEKDFICEKAKELVDNFIEVRKEQIFEQLGVRYIANLATLLTPYEVLFFKNGKYAILFQTKWSEDDMCILCDGINLKVDEGYILEFEY